MRVPCFDLRTGAAAFVAALLLTAGYTQEHDVSSLGDFDPLREAQPVEVLAVLEAFLEDGIVEDFADRSTDSYDVSVFVVLEPPAFRDRKITIVHSATPPEHSPWRAVGQSFRLVLPDELLLVSDGSYANSDSIRIEKIDTPQR